MVLKAETYKDYRSRVGRCVRLLESRPEEPVTLAALARAACLSKFHFLRVFAELAGESPISMGRRLRLEAAHRMLQKEQSVSDTAGQFGFTSQQAFSRRFRRQFGLAPSETRGRRPTVEVAVPSPVHLTARRVVSVPFRGQYKDLSQAFGGLLGAVNWLIKAPGFDVTFESEDCFATRPDDPCEGRMLIGANIHDIASTRLPCGWSADGWFLMFPGRGSFNQRAAALSRQVARAVQSGGLTRRPGAIVRRFINDPALVPIADQRWEIYVPILQP